MIKIEKQLDVGKYTLLILDSPVPAVNFKKVSIAGVEYETEIAYDMKNSIGVLGKGAFENEEIIFI